MAGPGMNPDRFYSLREALRAANLRFAEISAPSNNVARVRIDPDTLTHDEQLNRIAAAVADVDDFNYSQPDTLVIRFRG
ncbi:hypothetical protein [Saccharopolyspora griseoalba]|uniref:Uncharacterized protein n=1 Tax=Saccharopolyspora griseoalba TaxID=1431848 RepID=A0ABW2LRY8_9PSEU